MLLVRYSLLSISSSQSQMTTKKSKIIKTTRKYS
jgi:hypothetical protein